MFLVDDYVNFLYENALPSGYPGKLISAFRFSLRFREVPFIEENFEFLLFHDHDHDHDHDQDMALI